MIPTLTTLQQAVYFTFIMTFFGMIAGAVFFALGRRDLPSDYREGITLSAIICMIAAMNYYYMKDIYVVGVAGGGQQFPTEFRYIDWILTVPLMLVKFPTLLGMGRRGRQFLTILVALALLMIGTGYIGEVNQANSLVHYGLFGVGMVAWLLIVSLLFFALGELPEGINVHKKGAIRKMAMFVLFGWGIYPLGYLATTIHLDGDVRELVYNVGDLINKVGLGLVVYTSAVASRKAAQAEGEAAAEDAEEYASDASAPDSEV